MKHAIGLMALVILAGCSKDPDNVFSTHYFWTDPDTGCQYVTYTGAYGGSITPRLNPDGTQVCTQKEQTHESD